MVEGLGRMEWKKGCNGMRGCYLRHAKKDELPYLCYNLCYKLASERRILVLLFLCVGFVCSRRRNLVRAWLFNSFPCLIRSLNLIFGKIASQSKPRSLFLLCLWSLICFGVYCAPVSLKSFSVHFRRCMCDHWCTFKWFIKRIWLCQK